MSAVRYFDANATTPLSLAARTAWIEAADAHWHNPSSPSRASAAVHARLEQARERLASLFGTSPERVVFNSGATEGNRDALAYARRASPSGTRLAISAVEHPSVRENALAIWGEAVDVIPATPEGQADLGALVHLLAGGRLAWVSLMAANNETGVLQPWREALERCRAHGVALHVDAAQWIGKEPLNGLADVDLVTGCGHKFGGPKGTGFVLLGRGQESLTAQRGGAQENGHRAGTEDYPSIAALVAALAAWEAEREAVNTRWCTGRDAFERAVASALPGARVWGQGVPRLANTVSLLLPVGRGDSLRWSRRLDRLGYQVSTGSACTSGKAGPSPVLMAQGACPDEARRTIRVSALSEAGPADWLALAEAIRAVAEEGPEPSGAATVITI